MIDLYYWPTGNGLKIGILPEELGLEYRVVPINADRAIFPWIQPRRQGQELQDFPHIRAWRERLKARPAIQRAYAKGREVAANERALALQ